MAKKKRPKSQKAGDLNDLKLERKLTDSNGNPLKSFNKGFNAF